MCVATLYVYNHCVVVHGGWSTWTCGSCSKTCGAGAIKCTRRCDNPAPSCGGNDCAGSTVRQQLCFSGNPSKTLNHTQIHMYICIKYSSSVMSHVLMSNSTLMHCVSILNSTHESLRFNMCVYLRSGVLAS